MNKKEKNYAAELWKDKKQEAGTKKRKRKQILGNSQDDKKDPSKLITDAEKKGSGKKEK
jgi:hypothetical protein